MIDSIELRKVKNGYVVTVRSDEEDSEYIFTTIRQALKFMKDNLQSKVGSD
jgi:hypothetical protein